MEYHPSLSAKARQLQAQADETRAHLAELLGKPVLQDVHVRLGRTPGEMQKLAPKATRLPEYAGGVAFSEMGLVLLTATPRYPGERHDLPEVFRHELAHVALHDAVGRERVPRWFNEGFAIYASGEAQGTRMRTLWTATLAGDLLPLEELARRFPSDPNEVSIAYAQAADIIRYLLARGEEHRFRSLVGRMAGGQTFEEALSDAYSTDLYTLENEWKKDVARRYSFWPILLGGSTLWVLAVGLLVWSYVRRRQRARTKLARWAREEAMEDARRQLAQSVLRQAGPVRLVVAPAAARDDGEAASLVAVSSEGSQAEAATPASRAMVVRKGEAVPKVEHEGGWHTLH